MFAGVAAAAGVYYIAQLRPPSTSLPLECSLTRSLFCSVDGKIFIFTGILPLMKNDDGLATVLGHGGGNNELWWFSPFYG